MGLSACLIVSVIALVILFCVSFFCAIHSQDKNCKALVEGWKKQQALKTQKQTEALEKALESWLLSLKLPQFEKQTQRKEAAHLLSTVLIEKLLEMPCPQ